MEKLDAKAQFPDSLPKVLTHYEEIKDKVPGYMLLDYYMGYGNAMYRAEKYQEAIPLLEKPSAYPKPAEIWKPKITTTGYCSTATTVPTG